MLGTSQRFRKFVSGTAVAAAAIIFVISSAPLNVSAATSGSFQAPIAYAGHLIELDVMVNGKGPYKFALDTGASGARVSQQVAKDLALPIVGQAEGVGLGPEKLNLPLVKVSLALGTIHFDDVQAAVHDLPGTSGQGVDGVLGFDLFKDYLLTIDYPDGTISVAPGRLYNNERGTLPMMTPFGIPQIGGTIADDSIIIDIDSGSSGGFGLMRDYESQLKFVSAPKPIGQATGAGGTVAVDAGTVDGDVSFGDQTLHNPVVSFLPLPGVANMGYRVLSNYAITFDQADDLVRFVAKGPAPAASAQTGTRR